MAHYVERLWLLPALAIAADTILLLALWRLPSSAVRLRHVAPDVYEVMFWATPVVGVAVLSWVLWLKWSGPAGAAHPLVRRAVWFSLLALVAPVWMLLLQVVLSGFLR